MHSAGWLESGLVSCYEKFIVDIEILRMLHEEFTPLEVDEESLAFSAHEEVGAGRALPRRRAHARAVPRVLLPAAPLLDRELRALERATAARTRPRARATIWKKTLEEYEEPELDADLKAELKAYVDRRRTELGD